MVTLPLVLCDQIAHLSGQVQLDQVDIPPTRGGVPALARVLGDRLAVTPTMWILAVCALLGSLPVLASRLLRMRELPRELDLLDTSATADRE